MELAQFVVFAFLIEGIWEHGKMIWQDGKFSVDKIGVLITSCVFAVFLQKDIFVAIGMSTQTHMLTQLGTGILFSTGGNMAHEIKDKLMELLSIDK